MKRYVVDEDELTLEKVLEKLATDRNAIRDGRVFVGNARAIDCAQLVRRGAEIRVHDRASESANAARIVAVEDGVVVVEKPVHLPTIPDLSGSAHSLQYLVADELGCDPASLHPTSRLDRNVSGIVIFATSDNSRERLVHAREEGTYERTYVGIVEMKTALNGEGRWDVPIGRAKDPKKRAAFGIDAAPSATKYRVLHDAGLFRAMLFFPETGRTHQIRVHASHAGVPLVGDRDYGGSSRVTLANGRIASVDRVLLHARRVTIPKSDGSLSSYEAAIPSSFEDFLKTVGAHSIHSVE